MSLWNRGFTPFFCLTLLSIWFEWARMSDLEIERGLVFASLWEELVRVWERREVEDVRLRVWVRLGKAIAENVRETRGWRRGVERASLWDWGESEVEGNLHLFQFIFFFSLIHFKLDRLLKIFKILFKIPKISVNNCFMFSNYPSLKNPTAKRLGLNVVVQQFSFFISFFILILILILS